MQIELKNESVKFLPQNLSDKSIAIAHKSITFTSQLRV